MPEHAFLILGSALLRFLRGSGDRKRGDGARAFLLTLLIDGWLLDALCVLLGYFEPYSAAALAAVPAALLAARHVMRRAGR